MSPIAARVRLAVACCALLALLPFGSASAQSGGPDAFGTTYSPMTLGYTSLTLTGTNLNMADDAVATLALPFSFPFYGVSYTSIRVGENGALRVGTAGSIGYTNACLPTSTGSPPDIAVYWDDLINGSVYYRSMGAAGPFIVSWENKQHYGNQGGGTVSFQVKLFPSGRIEMHYSDTTFGSATYDNGVSATIGIQAFTAGQQANYLLQRLCNAATVSSGTASQWTACGDNDGDSYISSLCGGTDCDDTNAGVRPGATEICDGVDTNCDGFIPANEANVDGDAYPVCLGDCNDNNATVYPTATELCDGVDNDCVGGPNADAAGEVDLDNDGYRTCANDCADGNPAINPGAAETCNGIDDNCDGITGSVFDTTPVTSATNTAAPMFRGTMFLASQSATIAQVESWLDAPNGTSLTFAIYEATTQTGTFSMLTSQTVTTSTGAGAKWHGSGLMSASLTSGRYYAVGAHWTTPVGYAYDATAPAPLPRAAPWGQIVDGARYDTAFVSSFSQTYNGYTYRTRVSTPNEIDGDGDGSFACVDCDDTDPASFPGGTELCDGADSDCDGFIPANESDGDGDGQIGCAGDCDDGNPASYTGATEVCDAQDNDCNGSVPLAETADLDNDGSFGCADCDNNDATVFPGAIEVCDGADNDCDGQLMAGGLSGYTVGATPSTGGNRFRGNIWLADTDVQINQIEAYLSVPTGQTLTWAIYQGSSLTGAFTSVWTGTTTSGGTSAATWRSSPGLNYSFNAGSYYAVGVHFTNTAVVSYASSSTPFPLVAPFGDVVAGAAYSSAFVQPTSVLNTTTGYNVRVTSLGEVDSDGDGEASCTDCNDNDPTISSFATELCDGVDNNCDGVVPANELDGDGDGIAVCAGDCDDSSATTAPGLVELCDGVDNNCNGVVPPAEADADGDGFRGCAGDCIDTNAAVNPAAVELCNGLDDNCDGVANADAQGETDGDGDGVRTCDGDCDDGDAAVLPGATEVCDGADNDCVAGPDFDLAGEVDADADGSLSCEDCDDADPLRSPAFVELCDGIDGDCDGTPDFDLAGEADVDGDGFRTCTGDCDDNVVTAYPGAPEVCDGADSDCDGTIPDDEVDADGDGLGGCQGDCDDADDTVYDGAPELCDGLDNDCDGTSEDERVDDDADGFTTCDGDCDDEDEDIYPDAGEDDEELCSDELDNDCDGDVDADDSDCDGLAGDDDDSAGDDDDDDSAGDDDDSAGDDDDDTGSGDDDDDDSRPEACACADSGGTLAWLPLLALPGLSWRRRRVA